MAILSFSIDLSRSTEAKSLINDICRNNEERKDYLIKQYYRYLINIETDLYFHCIVDSIPLENLFLVKSIGDELWYVYDWDEKKYSKKEFVSIVLKFLYILSYVASMRDDFFISEKDVEWEEERNNPDLWENVKYKRITLPRKVFADILYDYYNFTADRVDAVSEKVKGHLYENAKYIKKGKNLSAQTMQERLKEELPKIAERLDLGSWKKESNDEFKVTNIRFDPIGSDVDLFFRCASKGIPSLFRVGQNLFELISSKTEGNQFVVEHGNSVHTSYEYLSHIKKIYRKGSLKGVFKDYNIHTIPIYTPPLSIVPWTNDDGCAKARKHLHRNNFIKINRVKQLVGLLLRKPFNYYVNKEIWRTFY